MLRRKYRKNITFSVPIKKEVANNNNNNNNKNTYKLEFIDSYRFMQSKLSDLVDNLSEINKKECPKCMGKKNKLNRDVII